MKKEMIILESVWMCVLKVFINLLAFQEANKAKICVCILKSIFEKCFLRNLQT